MTAKMLQRMPDALHGRLKVLARESDVSVNALVIQICEWYFAKGKGKLSPVEHRLADLESRVSAIESASATVPSTKASVRRSVASADPVVAPVAPQSPSPPSQSVSAFTW